MNRQAAEPEGLVYVRLAAILGAMTAMGPLAIDLYLPAFPAMVADLHTTPASVQSSLAVYFVGIALGQAFAGPLSDRLGRKPTLHLGLGVFVIASAGCAVAASASALLAARFFQALGGCAPLVVPRAIVRDYFDHRSSARMLSMLMLVMGLAPILAPLVGGQLMVHYGWRSIFWALATYGSVALLLSIPFLPESLPLERRHHHQLGDVVRTYRHLLVQRSFMRQVLTGGMTFSGLLAYIAGSPFVFIEIFDVSPQHYGLFFGMNAFGLIGASQLNRWLTSRYEPRRIVGAVLPVVTASGLVLLFNAYTGFGGFAGILVPLFFFLACHGFVMPNTTALAMAPYGGLAGSASALLGTVQFILGAAAGALVGVLSNGTAVPLAAVIAACGVMASVLYARAG